MKNRKCVARLMLLALSSLSACGTRQLPQGSAPQTVLELCEVAEDVGVRFWYLPPNTNASPGPLIFLPVSSQDPRLDSRLAWVLYVSASDLHKVVRVLERSRLEWNESNISKQLIVDPLQLPRIDRHTMEIAVTYINGSATSEPKAERICPLLSNVYAALGSSKAREAMAFWTGNVGCVMQPYQSSPPSK
jgi:hypothetical protein